MTKLSHIKKLRLRKAKRQAEKRLEEQLELARKQKLITFYVRDDKP